MATTQNYFPRKSESAPMIYDHDNLYRRVFLYSCGVMWECLRNTRMK